MVISCASPGNPVRPHRAAQTSIQAAPNRQWVKVRDHPPTWYPRGIPADCPTDHRNGDWVFTEDAQGTCFFIPRHIPQPAQRKQLLAEALAARQPDKVRRIDHEEVNHMLGTVTLGTLGRILQALAAAGV